MRLDPLRMAVASLALGPDIALARPPPDRARRTHAKPMSRRSTRQTTTFTAGLRYDGIAAPMVLDGPMNGDVVARLQQQYDLDLSPPPPAGGSPR